MKKNINKEVLAGLTKLAEENSLFGYLAAKECTARTASAIL